MTPTFKLTEQIACWHRLLCSRCLFCLAVFCCSPAVFAQENGHMEPADLVRVTISDISKDMRDNETLYAEQPQKLQAMVEQQLASHFNFARMTQLAMGKHWRSADAQQRVALIREFRALLIRSYTQTLFTYRYAEPDIESQKSTSETRTQLKIRAEDKSGSPVVLFLQMEKADQRWQVIDVNVEGVSLVISARSQFDEEIGRAGVDGLIQSLINENLGESG